MDHLQLQSAFKFVAISRFGDGGQLMTAANLCLEAVQYVSIATSVILTLENLLYYYITWNYKWNLEL